LDLSVCYPATLSFKLVDPGRVSINVYDASGKIVRELAHGEQLSAGEHLIHWDGKDFAGRSLSKGSYSWKLLETEGLHSEYEMSLGTTSSPRWRMWPGAYGGIRAICCDKSALYFGAFGPYTPLMVKQNHSGKREWEINSPFEPWQGPIALARTSDKLYMLQPNGMVYRFDADTSEKLGRFDASWLARPHYYGKSIFEALPNIDRERSPYVSDTASSKDMACKSGMLAVSYFTHDAIRWYRPETGRLLNTTTFEAPVAICFDLSQRLLVVSKEQVFALFSPSAVPELVVKDAQGAFKIAVDPISGDILIAEQTKDSDGDPVFQVSRFSKDGRFIRKYGKAVSRKDGIRDPMVLADVASIAPDYSGGFYVSEVGAPRRIVRFDVNGQLMQEWIGPQWASPSAEVDPSDPHSAWALGAPGKIVHYIVSLRTGDWVLDAVYSYQTALGGYFLTKNSGLDAWHVRHVGKETYLCADNPVRILRFDPDAHILRPVAAVIDSSDMPRSWVILKALRTINRTSAHFLWSDQNGDGDIQPDELTPLDGASWNLPNAVWFGDDLRIATVDAAGVRSLALSYTSPLGGAPVYDAMTVRKLDGSSKFLSSVRYPSFDKSGALWAVGRVQAADGTTVQSLCKWSASGAIIAAPQVIDDHIGHDLASIIGAPHGGIAAVDPSSGNIDVWDGDGLWAGQFLESPDFSNSPPAAYRLSNIFDHSSIFEDSNTGSIYLIGVGVNNNPVVKISGWNEWSRQEGSIEL
jgi:hypothetical protein